MRNLHRLIITLMACAALLTGCSPSKSEIEAKAKALTQQIIDENANLKPLGLVVDRVDAIQEQGNKYKGIAQVLLDGEHHQVPVAILADSDRILVTTENGAFAFVAGKIFAKAFENMGKELANVMPAAPVQSEPNPTPTTPMITETVSPSFDCAKAESASERLICADAELAEMDSDLARLYALSKASAKDSTAFSAQAKERWRQREAECTNKSCLVAWYTLRRGELLAWLPG